VFIKLPYIGASGVRLNKWMFTFVLTDLDGKNAVEGLVYSPNKMLDEAAEQLLATIDEARKYIEGRPIDLIEKAQLSKILSSLEMNSL
jgi:hypothetical protein